MDAVFLILAPWWTPLAGLQVCCDSPSLLLLITYTQQTRLHPSSLKHWQFWFRKAQRGLSIFWPSALDSATFLILLNLVRNTWDFGQKVPRFCTTQLPKSSCVVYIMQYLFDANKPTFHTGAVHLHSESSENKHLTPTPRKLFYQLHSTLLTCLDTVSRMGYPWVAKTHQYFSYPLWSVLLYVWWPGKTIQLGQNLTFSIYRYISENYLLSTCFLFECILCTVCTECVRSLFWWWWWWWCDRRSIADILTIRSHTELIRITSVSSNMIKLWEKSHFFSAYIELTAYTSRP